MALSSERSVVLIIYICPISIDNITMIYMLYLYWTDGITYVSNSNIDRSALVEMWIVRYWKQISTCNAILCKAGR